MTLIAFALALLAAQLVPQTLPDIGAPSTATLDRTAPATAERALDDFARLPLVFERDGGRYRARGAGYLFGFGDRGVSMSLTGEEGSTVDLTLAFVGANQAARPTAGERAPGVVNYVMGDDPDAWRTVPTFHEVVYEELWPGIDMVFTGTAGALKYDFVVAPGADVGDIALAYRGASDLSIANGALHIATPGGTLTDSRPVSYQRIDGTRTSVPTRFELTGASRYGFAVGAYDRSVPLRIDPAFIYSTYLGGNRPDQGNAIAVDSSGNAYVVGFAGTSFPTTPGAFDRSGSSDEPDAFVSKLSARGTHLLYSTFLGGSASDQTKTDIAWDVTVNRVGEAIVTGTTESPDFPTTPGAFQGNQGEPTTDTRCRIFRPCSTDAFVTKLSASGKLKYSTYLGGSGDDTGASVARDGSGNAYITGSTDSANFPTTPGAFQTTDPGSTDAFVTKLNAKGTALLYSTHLGGSAPESGSAIAVNSNEAFVTGATQSATDFPTTPGAFRTSDTGPNGSFVTRLNAAGSQLIYSTHLPGGSDSACGDVVDARGIAVDSFKNAYVAGMSDSCEMPVTRAFFDGDIAELNAFVLRLNPTGSNLIYSVLLGGSLSDWANDIALDGRRNLFITGGTESPGSFPTTPNALQPEFAGDGDAFMVKLNSNATKLLYASYLGGSRGQLSDLGQDDGLGVAVGGNAHIFVTGVTLSVDFPTTTGSFRPLQPGDFDAFVTRVQP